MFAGKVWQRFLKTAVILTTEWGLKVHPWIKEEDRMAWLWLSEFANFPIHRQDPRF